MGLDKPFWTTRCDRKLRENCWYRGKDGDAWWRQDLLIIYKCLSVSEIIHHSRSASARNTHWACLANCMHSLCSYTEVHCASYCCDQLLVYIGSQMLKRPRWQKWMVAVPSKCISNYSRRGMSNFIRDDKLNRRNLVLIALKVTTKSSKISRRMWNFVL